MVFSNFFKGSTTESSMRLVFIITAVTTLAGLMMIDIKFAINIIKYTGTEVSLVIAANSAFLISVIYGKNASKKLETNNNATPNQHTTTQPSTVKDPILPNN
jgi:hypothetical protein